jgi:probable HAF family extracellular repeat protein
MTYRGNASIEGAAVACVSRRVPGFRSGCLRHAALPLGLAASIALVQPAAADPFTPLGFLPGGTYSIAQGVNADGSVVVGFGPSTASGINEAFRWSGGIMTGLGLLPGGRTASP